MSWIVYEDPDYKIKQELASYKTGSDRSKKVKQSRKSKSSIETREDTTVVPSSSKSADSFTTTEVYNEDKPDYNEASKRLMEMLHISRNEIVDDGESSEWEDDEKLNGRRRAVDGEEEEDDDGEDVAYGEHEDFKVPLELILDETLGYKQSKIGRELFKTEQKLSGTEIEDKLDPFKHSEEERDRYEDLIDQKKSVDERSDQRKGQNYRFNPKNDLIGYYNQVDGQNQPYTKREGDGELRNKVYDKQYSRENVAAPTTQCNTRHNPPASRVSEPPPLPVLIRTQPEADGLKWYHDRPSPGHGLALREFKDAIFPLTWPMNLVQGTSTLHHYFDRPIDYLISWSDQCAAYGFVKRFEDATETVPLCIRFGGFWSRQAVKSMYIGCTVRVKGYLELKADVYHDEVLPVVPRGTDKSGFIFGGVPKPSAFALEWAVISRPNIVRSIGLLKEDISYQARERLHLVGIVRDVEYNEEFTVCDSKWPTPAIKCLPCPPYPVVINWLEIREKVIMHPTRHKSILLPEYIHHYMRTSEPTNGYVLGWVDLEMKPSRTFED